MRKNHKSQIIILVSLITGLVVLCGSCSAAPFSAPASGTASMVSSDENTSSASFSPYDSAEVDTGSAVVSVVSSVSGAPSDTVPGSAAAASVTASATVSVSASTPSSASAVSEDQSQIMLDNTSGSLSYGDYTYNVLADGTVILVTYTGTGGDVVVPSEVNGKTVSMIGISTFYNCKTLTTITIPAGVQAIGDQAIEMCPQLTAINVDPNNPNYTSQNGVLFDKNMVTLIQYPGGGTGSYVIPGSVTTIGDAAFCDTSGLVGVTIPEGVTSIGANAFGGCDALTSVALPSSLQSMGDYAFNSCDGLSSITIPANVTNMGLGVFSDCTGLTRIEVDGANANYASVNGVLFSKDLKTLIQYPLAVFGAYTVPDGVTTIGENAFRSCAGLAAVTFPDSLTTIQSQAFGFCNALTSVTLPSSFTRFGDFAFSPCENLSIVYFTGNAPQNGLHVFDKAASGFTIDHHAGASGWSNPWMGYPTATY